MPQVLEAHCREREYRCCALSVVRMVLGIIMIMHGGRKVLEWSGGATFTESLQDVGKTGFALFLFYFASFSELIGGIALVVGFLSRLAALGIVLIMASAIATIHAKNGFFLNWLNVPGKDHGYEYNLALAAMGLAIVIGGGGCLSLDSILRKRKTEV